MSELLDKQVNAQKESLKKNFWVSRKLLQVHHKKVWDENQRKLRNKKKRSVCKNVFDGRKEFIRRLWKVGISTSFR